MKTIYIGWLEPCPHCGHNGAHKVKTEHGDQEFLCRDDVVTCGSCEAEGLISIDDGACFVEWEDIE